MGAQRHWENIYGEKAVGGQHGLPYDKDMDIR
jgi:hypothetical protein